MSTGSVISKVAIWKGTCFEMLKCIHHSPVVLSMTSFTCLTQGPLNGGVLKRGASRSGLVLPFLSFLCFFWTFPIFPGFSRFARGWSGDFQIRPISVSRPTKSTYKEQPRKGPRHNPDLPRKNGKPPRFGTPPV